MAEETRCLPLVAVVINVFMVLVTATNPTVSKGDKDNESLEDLLAMEDFWQFQKGQQHRGPSPHSNVIKQVAVSFPRQDEVASMSHPMSERPELEIFVQEEDFMLPTDAELRHHRRKRQVIVETDGSGTLADGVETRVVLDVEFSQISDVSALTTAAKTMVSGFYDIAEMDESSLDVTATDGGNNDTILTFVTKFPVVNNRILVAYVFKKYVTGKTILTYTQKTEPSVFDASGNLKTVECFLCPTGLECGSEVTCQSPSTNVSTDLFPWGFSTIDDKLPHASSDSISNPIEMKFDFIFNGVAQKYVYVGDNGVLSFSETSGSGVNPPGVTNISTATQPIICAICYDVNLQYAGRTAEVFYHFYNVGDSGALPILERATNEVNVLDEDFEAQAAGVFTWYDVPYFESAGKTTPSSTRMLVQAVIITDGDESYVLLIFKDTQWPQSIQDNTVSGFEHLTTSELQNYLRRKVDGDQRQQIAFSSLQGNTGSQGKFLLKTGSLTTVSASTVAKQSCGTFYKTNIPLLSEFVSQANTVAQCPCSKQHIELNSLFTNSTTVGDLTCYDLIQNLGRKDGKRCCYASSGAYASDSTESRYLRFRRHFDAHNSNDVTPHDDCCTNSAVLCSLFTTVRPQTECTTVSSGSTSAGLGDPHIETLDGFSYTFNGYGEYTLMEINSTAVVGFKFSFKFQCRTVPALKSDGTASQATIFQAFAGQQEGSGDLNGGSFYVTMNSGRSRLEVYANSLDITNQFYGSPTYSQDFDNIVVSREDSDKVKFNFPGSGIGITVSLVVGTLSLETFVPEKHKTMTKGLLGTFDGNDQNDLMNSTGEAVLPTASDREIFSMGETWRVTEASSILIYTTANWTQTNNLDFVPVFFDEISDATKQSSLPTCTSLTNKQCILDFVATGNSALASSTKNLQTAAEDAKNIISNSAPVLTGTETISVKQGDLVSLTFQSTDVDGDAVTFVSSNQPATGYSINSLTGSATWRPADASPTRITVVAQDAKGLSSRQIDVRIVLCEGCQNGGACDYTTTRDSTVANAPDTFKLASCTCTTGWGGVDCSQDFDGCATQPCGELRTCTDVSPSDQVTSGKTFTCSACPDGYTSAADSTKCEDVNECTVNTHNCPANSQCANTIGSFLCNCNAGFRKQGEICIDINECAERTDDCTQTCSNTDSSFTCSCFEGFTLDADQKNCTQATLPASCALEGCSDICTEVESSPTCFCNSGYQLQADNKTCEDINECNLGICSQGCTNTAGSVTCSCFDGYKLGTDGRSCTQCTPPKWGPNCANTCACNGRASACDPFKGCICEAGWTGVNCVTNVNECEVNPAICNSNIQTCEDTQGSYKCTCASGYTKNGTDCVDTDECAAVTSPCPANSICQNTVGSYTCNCETGFLKVGNTCADINECTSGQTQCEQTCLNKPGSYNCQCNQGYALNDDRKTCRNFGTNPCGSAGADCQGYCVLESNTPTCKCNKGYTLAADNKACDDIDECADNTLNTCTDKATCNNKPGSFECSCPAGQKLANDERTCVACDDSHWGLNCANECGCSPTGSSSCDKVSGCVCLSGWTGDKCKIDKNECTTVTCHADSDCENLPGSYRCQCRTGYKESADKTSCEDIDECTNSNDNECAQNCTNTVGSYTCSCRDGFVLEGKGRCNDVDECTLGTSGCTQTCSNTAGGFNCDCFDGYTVDLTSPKNCIQGTSAVCITPLKDECTQNCRRSGVTEECFCNPGYELDADNKTCSDILECNLTPPRCSQTCTEEVGSFQCGCNDGFKLASDATTCLGCEDGKWGANCANNCSCDSSNSLSCNSVNGSCTCRTGWKGTTCTTDVPECTDTPSICGTKGVCNERPGSYACTCQAGFIRSGDVCVSCDSKHYGANCAETCACDITNSISCNAVDGTCTCKPEYKGATCTEDVNECNNVSACTGAHETCRNTIGSFACDCVTGYVKVPNDTCVPCNFGFYGTGCTTQCNCVADNIESCNNVNGSCTCKSGWNDTRCDNNIDECRDTGSPVCTGNLEVCRDTQGSYMCDCESGYYKAPNNTCIVCDKGKYGANCSEDCQCIAENFISCNNFNGSCTCKTGWEGSACATNVNECLQTTPVCNVTVSSCRDTQGSYVCDCKTGYNNSADGSCDDIDECSDSSLNNCAYVCNNTVGSFFCSCPQGFSGTGNTCLAVYRAYDVVVIININRVAIIAGNRTAQAWIDLAAFIADEISKIVKPIFGSAHLPVVVKDMQSGSIISTAELRVDPTKTSTDADALAAAGIRALANTPSITIDGTIAAINSIEYNGTRVSPTSNACDILKSVKTLASDEYCELGSDGIPVIRKLSSTDPNIPLIIGLTVPITLVVGVLLALLIYVCCCKSSKSSQRTPSDEGRDNVAFRSAFVGNVPTKGNFGASRYMMYSPHTLSETASQASGENGFRYMRPKTLEGRSDFLDMPGPSERGYSQYNSPRDGAFGEEPRSNFSWENMFNMLEPSRNAPFEVPRPNVSNSPNRVYRNGKHDSLA